MDGAGNTNSCTTIITVADQTAPKIVKIAPSPRVLRPAWWQMIPVDIKVTATDNCDPEPVCKIVSVTTNTRDGKDNDDKVSWVITGDLSVKLRAVPSTARFTRIYRIKVECKDAAGNTTTRTVNVTVARDGK